MTGLDIIAFQKARYIEKKNINMMYQLAKDKERTPISTVVSKR